jgi:hypothetical protein
MSSQIPPAGHYLLTQARYETERKLVESVKQKTRKDMAKTQPEEFEIEGRAERIANEVFKSEYESSLAEFLPNPTDRNLLVNIRRMEVIDHLVDVSISVFQSKA